MIAIAHGIFVCSAYLAGACACVAVGARLIYVLWTRHVK